MNIAEALTKLALLRDWIIKLARKQREGERLPKSVAMHLKGVAQLLSK